MRDILELNRSKFNDDEKLYNFLLEQIKKHVIEIKQLHNKKDPHEKKEIADIYLLAKMFLELNKVSKDAIDERKEKIRDKIKNG